MELLLAYLVGILGVLAHWLKKSSRNQTSDSLLEHFKHNMRHTVGTLASLTAAIATVTSTGVDLSEVKDLSLLFLTGYTLDSAINKNSEDGNE